ncbi:hypothetical protein, conserved [Eimeria acervulina]|uniref:Uncharacterized protein n=1 Tax=Eimeria acervulina TaxID=5801 RepID=U6GHG1_EIMAC|nr:hypothetical protein, conserved [Eimeria acervulina]CDI78728.1 hypothetical protein, conserved [Eimeria acervulina]
MAKAREEKQMRKVVEKNLNKKKDHTVEHEGRKRMLPEDVQARMLADAEALEQRHRQRVKDLKRQKFIKAKKTLYSKLKFYELKKVQRRLQQTRKELLELMSQQQENMDSASAAAGNGSVSSAAAGNGEALGERIAEAQRKLRLHLDDLNYIRSVLVMLLQHKTQKKARKSGRLCAFAFSSCFAQIPCRAMCAM